MGRALVVVALVACCASSANAHAQRSARADPVVQSRAQQVAQRSIDRRWAAAGTLYATGGISILVGTLVAELTVMGLASSVSPPPCGSCDTAFALMVTGMRSARWESSPSSSRSA